ncbi:MAG: glycosyltransferase, partial [Chitinophagaceae bacterium]|nr:glycosyltransferase [Rubrivivax sp.]
MADPQFTVVVPTYNRAGLLPETLDGILQQRPAPLEVIVV